MTKFICLAMTPPGIYNNFPVSPLQFFYPGSHPILQLSKVDPFTQVVCWLALWGSSHKPSTQSTSWSHVTPTLPPRSQPPLTPSGRAKHPVSVILLASCLHLHHCTLNALLSLDVFLFPLWTIRSLRQSHTLVPVIWFSAVTKFLVDATLSWIKQILFLLGFLRVRR